MALVLMASADAEATRAITYWLLGSMASARRDAVLVCAIATLAGLVVIWANATALDAFSFGSDTATSLGIDVRTTRRVVLVVTALLTAVAVASVGAIGFVGLIVRTRSDSSSARCTAPCCRSARWPARSSSSGPTRWPGSPSPHRRCPSACSPPC